MLALLILLGFTFAIVIVVIVGVLRSDVNNLRHELRGLSSRIDQLERGKVQPPSVEARATPVAEKKPMPESVPASVREVEAVPAPSPQPPPVPLIVPPPAAPTRTRAEWEALIGGKFLNRIGALALIIGMGFFLKYAFDQNWITEWMRVGIGIGVGILLLAGGARFHRKGLPIFAQGLVGAGIAILYLSVYASFNFYRLVSQPVAFGLMSVVTVLTFMQAIRYNGLAVSILGWLGGFITPLLLSTGEARPVGLFSYVAMLDIGLNAVLLLRPRWKILAPLSVAATYSIYYLWYDSTLGGGDGIVAVSFLCLFWFLFHGYDVLVARRRSELLTAMDRVTGIGHVIIFYPVFYAVVDRYFSSWLAPATCALAALYAGSYFLLRLSSGKLHPAMMQFAITSVVLLVIGTEIEYRDFVVIAAYAVEAVAVFWIGRTSSLKYLWRMGLGILVWACLVLLVTDNALFFQHAYEFVPLWNVRLLAFLSIVCGAGAMLLFMRNEGGGNAGALRTSLHVVWVFFLFLLITTETSDYFRRLAIDADDTRAALLSFQRLLTMGILWLTFGVTLLLVGQNLRTLALAVAGFCLVLLGTGLVAFRGIAFDPVDAFVPLFNIRALVLVLTAGLLAWCLVSIGRHGPPSVWQKVTQWGVNPAIWLRVMLVVVTLSLISGEIRDYFERAIALRDEEGSLALTDLENLKQVCLSCAWLGYSIVLMGAGLLRRVRSLRIIAMVLFGIAILKIFFYDLSFLETLYRIISFIGLGIILLTVSYLYQRYRSAIVEDSSKS